MPWEDFIEMMAFNSISPISDERQDLVGAFHTASIVNTVRSLVNPDQTPVHHMDLMPFSPPRDPEDDCVTPESPEHEVAAVREMFAGARIKKG